jgi:hypothetical protein
MREHVARMGEKGHAYNSLFGASERKIPLGRLRRRWKDNTDMNLKKIKYGFNRLVLF